MLAQITYWMQVTGTVIDGVLLIRVLSLRLQKTYLYITLACVLTLLFDVAAWWFGFESEISQRLFLYSRFLYVVVFPMVVWDVFEEIKAFISRIRRLAILRLISGLFFTTILSLVLLAFADTETSSGESGALPTLAVILWAGASTASLAFLITIHRVLRTQPLEIPNNTRVWMRYWEFELGCELLTCFWLIIQPLVRSEATMESIGLALLLFTIAITLWCIVKLRRIPEENAGSAVEKAST